MDGTSPHRSRRSGAGRRRSALAVGCLVAFLLAGCGGPVRHPAPAPAESLVEGARGHREFPEAVARVATRFAEACARIAYRPSAPQLPDCLPAVRRAIAAAAGRVPPGRRRLRPHLLRLGLLPDRGGLRASASIGDGRFPPFSVGFRVARRGRGWVVASFAGAD